LRYPGGKTWLVPHIRAWLATIEAPQLLIEPFAGGGIASLTAVMENLVPHCLMVEIDQDVAAFWVTALHNTDLLISRIDKFTPTHDNTNNLEHQYLRTVTDRGFRTLVLNRTRRGGILTKGAAAIRTGENGRGITSRWYPDTINQRLTAISDHAARIDFLAANGITILEQRLAEGLPMGTAVFADPPYTAVGKQAGRRLYTHNSVDHPHLFDVLAQLAAQGCEIMATYDESPEIIDLVDQYDFHAVRVMMKNTHHNHVAELVITNREVFS
jgi:DNA adenine methylase